MFFKIAFGVIWTCWLLLLPVNAIAQNVSNLKITATGTGQTTGHIADLKIVNPSSSPVQIASQTVYIPSDGQYQPYITTIPSTTIPPGSTTIPLDGYCADVHTPAVPSGDAMIPVDDWIPVGPISNSTAGTPLLPGNPLAPFTPEDIPHISNTPGFTPTANPTPSGITPTWPGTDVPVGGTFNPIGDPKTIAPVLVHALDNIAKAFDKLKEDGKINTPFGGDPVKEREAVIQQTFWIYTASITSDLYTKDHFGNKLLKQFEKTQGVSVATLPEKDKQDLGEGIDVFWSVFTATGTEAKVLAASDENAIPGINIVEDNYLIGAGDPPLVTDALSQTDAYKHNLKECFFNKLEYKVDMEQTKTRGSGKNKKITKEKIIPNDKNEATTDFKKDDILTITLKDLKCECLCWTSQASDGTKSGSFCDCSVSGITQQSFNPVFNDEMAETLDKETLDSLKKSVQKKLDNLKANGGKKTDIDKLEKQLKDDKKLVKDNAEEFKKIKAGIEGGLRLNIVGGNAFYSVPKSFVGDVEFIFNVQGTCKGDATCKGATFSREVKIKIKCK